MRSRFAYAAPAGSSVRFGMAEAIQNKLPVWTGMRGDVQLPNPLTVPPSGEVLCYLEADKAYDIEIVMPDGVRKLIEDPALEIPEAIKCECISKDMFEAMRGEQDAQRDALDSLSDQYSDVIEALAQSQERELALSRRLEVLEGREVEPSAANVTDINFSMAFLKDEQLPSEDSVSVTSERLRREFDNLLNAMQDFPTDVEKSRFQEMTANKI